MNVSVALCTYNGEKYIRKQVESIMQQTIPPNEIVICDDCSTDGTVAILKELQGSYPCLQIFEGNQNIGVRKNFEKALETTTGDVIFLADQDDVWMPGKVSLFLEAFKKRPQLKGIFSDGYLLYDNEIAIGKGLWEAIGFNETMMVLENQYNLLSYINYFDNVVTGAALAITREAKEIILPFQMSPKDLHDYWICNALAQDGSLAPLPQKTFAYRIHPGQQVGIVNERYIRYLDKAKQKLLYNKDTLSSNEEFYVLWGAYVRYLKLKNTFGAGSTGVSFFKKDLDEKITHFFRQLSLRHRVAFRFKWMAKKAQLAHFKFSNYYE